MLKKHVLSAVIVSLILLAIFQLGTGVKIASKAWLSQFLIDNAWSRTLEGEVKVRPWPWADTWPVAELNVPSLNLKQVVLSGDSGATLAFGPGMNDYVDEGLDLKFTIVSGHRDTHFSFLEDIRLEDVFEFTGRDGEARQYQVFDTRVVDQNWTFPEVHGDLDHLMILSTCYPFDSFVAGADKRLLVFAVPIENA